MADRRHAGGVGTAQNIGFFFFFRWSLRTSLGISLCASGASSCSSASDGAKNTFIWSRLSAKASKHGRSYLPEPPNVAESPANAVVHRQLQLHVGGRPRGRIDGEALVAGGLLILHVHCSATAALTPALDRSHRMSARLAAPEPAIPRCRKRCAIDLALASFRASCFPRRFAASTVAPVSQLCSSAMLVTPNALECSKVMILCSLGSARPTGGCMRPSTDAWRNRLGATGSAQHLSKPLQQSI